MIFDYRRYVFQTGIAYRPVLTLKIIGPRGTVRWDALVDTGSDITLLPRMIAEDVGIDLTAADVSTIRGVGNQSVDVRESGVELEITDGDERYRWDARVSFFAIDETEPHFALLGHRGCLDFFVATFDADNQAIEITPAGTFPGTVIGGR